MIQRRAQIRSHPRRHRRASALHALAILGILSLAPAAQADWPTARGTSARTGNLDNLPGPQAPAVLWAYKAPEHFIASPVPAAEALYVSSLGAFNTASFQAMSLEVAPANRILWKRTTPLIKLPTVSSPALADGLLIFGDGMHQTDGAVLYGLRADTGLCLWQFPLDGKLVHMEGAPSVVDGKVFIGGGDAGVLCLDTRHLTLNKKDISPAQAQALIADQWKQLQAKYEQDRQKDPLALAPDESALPQPAPKLLWQKGAGKLHVDAPLALTADRVLVASAYIDADKAGKRALVLLNLDDGATVGEIPLKYNPWGGPTVSGDLALVGCSSIRFDAAEIKNARGEIVAVDLATSKPRWQRDLPGGVLSPVAATAELAVFTCTDGQLRAFRLDNGEQRFAFDAKAPFFAAPAIAGNTVYAVDLTGVLHAISLADGQELWSLNVVADPAVAAPGHVFGSPVVQNGMIYLATCNLETQGADARPSVVVCVGDRALAAHAAKAATVTVDARQRTVAVPCRIAPRKLATLKEIYPLEVVATFPSPRGQKAHETVVIFDAKPSDVHKALESLGLQPGRPARGEGPPATGPELRLWLELPSPTGKPRRVPIERTMLDTRTGRPMPPLTWRFTGSALRQLDPDKPERTYGADVSGTLISLYPVTDETVIQSSLTMKEEPLLKLETSKTLLPEEGTPATLIIEVPR